ncbi:MULTISPECIES: hypothetical protein [unclassified Luteococcus]|uniref:hypothetical protein n=1 Tax=unclassified Luteococcus TaxID=2639923 RepID=UPI00313DD3DA
MSELDIITADWWDRKLAQFLHGSADVTVTHTFGVPMELVHEYRMQRLLADLMDLLVTARVVA